MYEEEFVDFDNGDQVDIGVYDDGGYGYGQTTVVEERRGLFGDTT